MGSVSVGIFARAPESGTVKSRLIPALGVDGARAAYCELVEGTLARLTVPTPEFTPSLWVTQRSAITQRWAQDFDLACFEQADGDLGMRMLHALDALLQDAKVDGAAIVGTDCPAIDAAYVKAGCALLQTCDVVFGPAEDGGYGLVMCRKAQPELFADMTWGVDTVLRDSLSRARQLNLSVGLLSTIWDVDRPEDWRRYCEWRGSS